MSKAALTTVSLWHFGLGLNNGDLNYSVADLSQDFKPNETVLPDAASRAVSAGGVLDF